MRVLSEPIGDGSQGKQIKERVAHPKNFFRVRVNGRKDNPETGSSRFLHRIGNNLPDCMMSHLHCHCHENLESPIIYNYLNSFHYGLSVNCVEYELYNIYCNRKI
jgi:hypothetical protein